MHTARALTALALLGLLASAGTAAAVPIPALDPDFLGRPVRDNGGEVQEAILAMLYDSADTVIGAAALFQERFDALRAIAEDVAAEVGATVNGCPVGGALPAIRVPQGSAELRPDPVGLVVEVNTWGDDLAVPLNAEADCRLAQAPDVGAPPLDAPDAPSLPGLPDAPSPEVPGIPAIPDAEVPEPPALPLPA